MDKKISVIVPVYNVEKLLGRCVDSIRNQIYQNLEIILVDDGSTDQSSQICDDFTKKDSRIKVIHKQNSGAAAARNTGIENSTGEYIAFVDSDDYIELNMYSEMMKINEQYDCDMVMCDCYKENVESKFVFTHDIRPGYYDKKMLYDEYFPTLLMKNSVDYPPTISNCVCLIKKQLLVENQIKYKEEMRFSEDLLFGSQVMYYANNFYYMKEHSFYHYIMNPNSVTNTYYKDKWMLMKQLYLAIDEFFSNKNDYDFNRQINLFLLFIVYHCIGNIKRSNESRKIKLKVINNILNDKDVIKMFQEISILSLDISWKLKIITFSYKMNFY